MPDQIAGIIGQLDELPYRERLPWILDVDEMMRNATQQIRLGFRRAYVKKAVNLFRIGIDHLETGGEQALEECRLANTRGAEKEN